MTETEHAQWIRQFWKDKLDEMKGTDDCEDYEDEETFEHHWEMMDDIEREEYNSLWRENEDEE